MAIVNLPAGVTFTPALLKQIVEECGTCNPCGSGSGNGSGGGSGSGGGGFTLCCGCESFPEELQFTATSGCMGTISGTLTRVEYDVVKCTGSVPVLSNIISYSVLIRSGTGYDCNGFDCRTGAPVSGSDLGADTALFSLVVSCVRCPASDPPGKGWFMTMLWYDFSLGTFRRIEMSKPVNDPVCTPVVFSTVSGPVVCIDDATVPTGTCAVVGILNEPWTTYTECDGSSFTLDVSE